MTVCTLCFYILLLFISCRIPFYELIGMEAYLTKFYEHYGIRVLDTSCLYAMTI